MSGFNSRDTNTSISNIAKKTATLYKSGNGSSNGNRSPFSSSVALRQTNSSTKRQSRKSENDASYEDVLHHALVQMAQIVLKANAQRTVHDVTSFSGHLQGRAEQMVDEEINNVMTATMAVTGSLTGNKIAAYSYVTTALLRDLERVSVVGDHKIQLSQLRDSNQLLRNESSRVQAQLTQDIAHREQKIRDLETEISILHYKNESLLKTVELLSSELQRCTRTLNESQENYVNLCLKSLELKGDVDDCCDTVLSSITSRIGFVPNSVIKSITALKNLKPPGDPSLEVLRKYNKRKGRKSKLLSLSGEAQIFDGVMSDASVENENIQPANNNSLILDVRANGLVSASVDKSVDSISFTHSTVTPFLPNAGDVSSQQQVEGENVASKESPEVTRDDGTAAFSTLLDSYKLSR